MGRQTEQDIIQEVSKLATRLGDEIQYVKTQVIGEQRTISRVAAQNVGGYRVVYVNDANQVVYADHTDNTAYVAIGITLQAAQAGDIVYVLINGFVTELAWNWDATKPLFLGVQGQLQQTPPTTGVLRVIARPASPDTIYVKTEDSLQLA